MISAPLRSAAWTTLILTACYREDAKYTRRLSRIWERQLAGCISKRCARPHSARTDPLPPETTTCPALVPRSGQVVVSSGRPSVRPSACSHWVPLRVAPSSNLLSGSPASIRRADYFRSPFASLEFRAESFFFLVISLRPALWLILFDLARASLRPNRISRRSGLCFAPFFKRQGSPLMAWPAPASFRRLILSPARSSRTRELVSSSPLSRPAMRLRLCSASFGAFQYRVLRPSFVVPANSVLPDALLRSNISGGLAFWPRRSALRSG